jgi:hypothetical protein
MKIAGLVTMVAVAAASAYAGERVPERERVAVVCVYPGNELRVANDAQMLASDIFAQIGVRIEWHSSAPCPSAAPVIQITFSEETPATLLRDAWAYAMPYERTHIVVFYDRIKRRNREGGPQQLLAYVMVHEITHILQGVNRHSATGLMRAQWSGEDYFQMRGKRLGFAAGDVDLIYRGLDVREARVSGATPIAWQ